MEWELDHIFFATAEPNEVEQFLSRAGMVFEPPRAHPGQGTDNVCAVFENAYFEVVFLNEPGEIGSAAVQPLGLHERIHWRDTGACPFGLCFRSAGPAESVATISFKTWGYEAAYLPKGKTIPIVTPPYMLGEPLVFISPFPRRPLRIASNSRHRIISGVQIWGPFPEGYASTSAGRFLEQGVFSIKAWGDWRLELEWDGGREGQSAALSTRIPVALRW